MIELYPAEAVMLSIIWLLIGYAIAEAVICFIQNKEDITMEKSFTINLITRPSIEVDEVDGEYAAINNMTIKGYVQEDEQTGSFSVFIEQETLHTFNGESSVPTVYVSKDVVINGTKYVKISSTSGGSD